MLSGNFPLCVGYFPHTEGNFPRKKQGTIIDLETVVLHYFGFPLSAPTPLEVVSRGDWQKNQYRSFVPFLHTLVPYPNQRRKSSIFRIFRHHHTSWPEMVMEKFVGIRPQTGSGIREGGDGRVD